jgi:hypothetical protein
MRSAESAARPRRGPRVQAGTLTILALLTAGALALRLPALRALPVFGDEAIFLHLARLLRADPARDLWIPLQIAMAPVHIWVLAIVLPVSADPVLAGRLFSVATGVALVPALFLATSRIGAFLSPDPKEPSAGVRPAALWSAAILAASPFFVFADRMARVDSLFALEVTVVAAVSIDLSAAAAMRRGVVARGVLLGLCMGVTMLTRQAVSYPLWALPVLAFLLRPTSRGDEGASRAHARPLLVALGIALGVAAILWFPMLTARRPDAPDLMTRIFHLPEYRPPMSLAERFDLCRKNLGIALAAFGRYLTPPICLAALGGALVLARSRGRRLLLFLAAWETLLIAPTVLFAIDYFPRFALPAALPLVVAAGFGAARTSSRAGTARLPAEARRLPEAGLLAILLLWPLFAIVRGERDWRRWPLLPIDREQFVSGPQAGFATEAAIRFLEAESAGHAITVLTPEFSGNPTDALWLLLDGRPEIRLSYALDALRAPLLDAEPGRPGVFRLGGDLRERTPPRLVALPDGDPVYVVSTDPLQTRAGWAEAESILGALNPGLAEVARVENPRESAGSATNAVVVFRVR